MKILNAKITPTKKIIPTIMVKKELFFIINFGDFLNPENKLKITAPGYKINTKNITLKIESSISFFNIHAKK